VCARTGWSAPAFSEHLGVAGITPSVGAGGSSFDNASAETINGLYKTELIKSRGPWRTVDDVEVATARAITMPAPSPTAWVTCLGVPRAR
jgi:transposase InsO family protein